MLVIQCFFSVNLHHYDHRPLVTLRFFCFDPVLLLGEIDTRFSFCAVATLALLVSFEYCIGMMKHP